MNKYLAITILVFSQISKAETYAFVGSPVLAERTEESCMDYMKDPNAVCMDMAFRLVYKIEKMLKGSYAERTIEMIGFYHYRGLPEYTQYDPAILFVSGSSQNGFILKSIEPVLGGDEEEEYICTQWSTSEEDICILRESVESYVELFEQKI